jgi:2-dehydro-3-deoxyphosphogluconate aldolase/(4S)-4-hydroxy-2-oxoglutarate aldolase
MPKAKGNKPKSSLPSKEGEFGSILKLPILPVLATIPDEKTALHVAEALQKAGLLQIEITFRSPASPAALQAVVREFPEVGVGAGTLLTPVQVKQARDGGARFGVAPGSNPKVMAAARKAGLPFLPGVATPTEIELALEQGFLWQKIPGVMGNLRPFLDWLRGAYGHTGLRMVPAGGTTIDTLAQNLDHPLIGAVAGSWIMPSELIREKKWDAIGALSARSVQVVRDLEQRKKAGG